MALRKILSYDEEIDNYLNNVITSLKMTGIKNVSKADALRFIIKQNEQSKVKFKRKPKTKNDFVFIV
jgi:hypothetical protein